MTAILFEHFHGAVTRVGVTDTAVPHREEGFNLSCPRSGSTPPSRTRTSPGLARRTRPPGRTSPSGRWLNYLADDQGDDAVRAAYGPNYDRLVEVKRRYDPDNVFSQNHNIVP